MTLVLMMAPVIDGYEGTKEEIEMMQVKVAGEDGVRELSLIDPDSGVDFEKGKGTMRYWMIHGGNGGEQLGCWQAESAEEALEMLAKAAGYASKEEADRVLQESGGHVYPEEIEEITREEHEAINALLELPEYGKQRSALEAYRRYNAYIAASVGEFIDWPPESARVLALVLDAAEKFFSGEEPKEDPEFLTFLQGELLHAGAHGSYAGAYGSWY